MLRLLDMLEILELKWQASSVYCHFSSPYLWQVAIPTQLFLVISPAEPIKELNKVKWPYMSSLWGLLNKLGDSGFALIVTAMGVLKLGEIWLLRVMFHSADDNPEYAHNPPSVTAYLQRKTLKFQLNHNHFLCIWLWFDVIFLPSLR